jgi:CHASE3 domain sensor protein
MEDFVITELPAVEPLKDGRRSRPYDEPPLSAATAGLSGLLQPAGLINWADAGILLSLLLIGFMSYFTLRSAQRAESDAEWGVHAQAVQKTLQSAFGNGADTVAAGRTYALTGKVQFLDAEHRATKLLGEDLDTLRQLTADNPGQHARLERLEQQVNTSLEATLRMESFRERTGKLPSDVDFLESKRCMDAVWSTIVEMQTEESKLLALRRAAAQEERHSIRVVVFSSALLALALLPVAGLLLRLEMRRGARMQAQLRKLNADLERQAIESRWAEAEAHRNELRLLGVAESSLDCLYLAEAVRDAEGEIEDFILTYVNENAVRLVTVPRDQMIGARMCDLFPVNRKVGLLEKYKQVVATGESFVSEFPIHDESIKTEWLRIQAAKLGDGVAITASDITGRKLQEEALRTSKALLERTERLTDTGGWEVDLRSNNPEF